MPPSKKTKSVAAALAPSAQPAVVLPTEPVAPEPQLPPRIEGHPGPELNLPAEPVDGESLADLVGKLAEGRLELPALPAHASQVGEGVQVDSGYQGDGTPLQPVVPPGHIRVRVLRQVEHDGRLYGPDQIAGDEINMPAAQAEALLPTGAIERM